jgi:type IX secretion system PorP/SprF family membrane protein
MRKKIVILFFIQLIPLSFFGQLTPVSDQYVLNPLTINPAFAGNRGALNIAAFYRRQWIGVTGAPETATLTVDAPVLDNKLGLGLAIINDKIGVTKQTALNTDYSYKIRMGEGTLSFGLGAGIVTTQTAWGDLVALDPGDEAFLASSRVFVLPDIRFGTYYSYRNYFAGLSVPKLISYKFDFERNNYSLSFNPSQDYYMFNTGYIFQLNPKVKFFPSTLVIFSSGKPLLFDLNAHFNLYDRFWIGASYRNGRAVEGLFQIQLNTQLRLAYTYDADIGKIGRYREGSHEIMIRYEFHYKVNVVNPLNF